VGLLPAIILFFIAPQDFIFWNTRFIQFNMLYRAQSGEGRMDLFSKLTYLFKDVYGDPGNLLLLLATIFFGFSTELVTLYRERKYQLGSSLALMLAIFLTLGALVPSPSYYQYFYSAVPFAILGIIYGISRFCNSPYNHLQMQGSWALALFLQVVFLSSYFTIGDYARITTLKDRSSWEPVYVHAVGKQLKEFIGQGKVLTLSPIYPLEGKLDIYPELATGPFVWRAAHLVPDTQRQIFGAVSKEDLVAFLAQDPPNAIFLTAKTTIEKPIIRYAQRYEFEEQDRLPQNYWLWTP
jgi:hypothetical protein